MGGRGRAYDEWSLVSQQQLHDDVSSHGLSGDEKGEDAEDLDENLTARSEEKRKLAPSPASSSRFSRVEALLYGQLRALRSNNSTSELGPQEECSPSNLPAPPSCPAQEAGYSTETLERWIHDSPTFDGTASPAFTEKRDPFPSIGEVDCARDQENDQDDGVDESVSQAWEQTELLAADIRQSSLGVPEIKAPAVDRYMKVLVVGQPGLGKTTFLNNIRASFGQTGAPRPSEALLSHPSVVHTFSESLYEVPCKDGKGNRFYYYLQDTKGFSTLAEALPLLESIQMQSESYFKIEQDGKRTLPMAMLPDHRVDVCLYFVPPHAIYPLDIEVMGRISQLVPVIPIIAKADSMTPLELDDYRMKVARDLSSNGVAIHKFSPADASLAGFNHAEHVFSVVASKEYDEIISRSWPVRQYPWGLVEVLNRAHSDVPALKNLVFALGYEAFKVDTETRYLAYRKARLEGKPPPAAHMAVCNSASKELSFKPRLSSRKKQSFSGLTVMGLMLVAFALGVFLTSGAFWIDSRLQGTNNTVPRVVEVPKPVPVWSEGYLADVRALHTSKQAEPDSPTAKIMLGGAEYDVLLRILKDMLSVPFPSDRNVVNYLIQMLQRARADASRILPPAPLLECPAPSTPPPAPHQSPGAELSAAAADVGAAASHIAQSLVRNVQSHLPSIADVGQRMSRVGRDVSHSLSALNQEAKAGLSKMNKEAKAGLSKMNREAKAGLQAAEQLLPSLQDVRLPSLGGLGVGERVKQSLAATQEHSQRLLAAMKGLQPGLSSTRVLLRRLSIVFAFL